MSMLLLKRLVLWFRNDLRIHDNVLLHTAINELKTNNYNEVICCYCFDPRSYETTPYNSIKCDKHRAKFVIDSVNDLRSNLDSIGSNLIVSYDHPENTIARLCSSPSSTTSVSSLVLVQRESAYEETFIANKVNPYFYFSSFFHYYF